MQRLTSLRSGLQPVRSLVHPTYESNLLKARMREWDFTTGAILPDVSTVRNTVGTYRDNNGLLKTASANQPRITMIPGTSGRRGIYSERLAQNKFTHGTLLTNWSKASICTLTLAALTSPDGTTNAALLIPDASSGVHWLGGANNPAITAGAKFSLSMFLKRNGVGANRYFRFTMRRGDFSAAVGFDVDLQTNTIQSYSNIGGLGGAAPTSVRLEDWGNGWVRCIADGCILDSSTTATTVEAYFIPSMGGGSTSTGDAVNGIGLYGMQFEESAVATSYIPTVASAVTRNTEVHTISLVNANWFNPVEGTLYVESVAINEPQTAGSRRVISINDTTSDNRLDILRNSSTARIFVDAATVDQSDQSIGTWTDGTFAKIAMRYKANDCAAVINAGTVSTDTSVTIPTGLTQIQIGTDNISRTFDGVICKFRVYYAGLPNATLQDLSRL